MHHDRQKNGYPGGEDTGQSHCGHRKRLLERFERSSLASLHLHEIIELILTYTIPRRDTKSMAHELVRRYKSLGALLNAPREEIVEVAGIGNRSAAFFMLIREIIGYSLREKYEQQSLITHRGDVEEYLRFYFGHLREEFVAALYLGNRNQVIETRIIAEGTVNQCVVYPRMVMENALRVKATSIIIAHNHPGGGHAASEADWLLTERLFTICKLMEIPLMDHLIISRYGVVSLKELTRWPALRVK
jgi:DNA repair protein RadC